MAVCKFDFVLKLVFIISVAVNTGLNSVAEHRDSVSLNLEVASTNDSRDQVKKHPKHPLPSMELCGLWVKGRS